MRPRILLVNGPPRSGKDSVGKILKQNFEHVFSSSFAAALKLHTHRLYGAVDAPVYAFEEVKDQPHRLFRGLTPRQAYIAVSETLFKPLHGHDIWGRVLLEGLQWADVENEKKGIKDPLYVITDSGFAPEAAVVIEQYGKDAVELVRLHRAGCDFKKDSRNYIELPVKTVDWYADDMDQLETCAFALAEGFGLVPRKESQGGRIIQFPHPPKPAESEPARPSD